LQGYGIAMGDLCLVEHELKLCRLIAPFPLSIQSGAAYYLVYPEQKVLSPALKLFHLWLEQEALLSRQQLKAHLANAETIATPEVAITIN